ncbi:hypothetical protein OH492_29460 [Vibrio chagasii]|nr:hypothetical protein [Vibrio chagasii]
MRKNIDKWVASESEQFSLLFIDIDNFRNASTIRTGMILVTRFASK